MVFQEESFLTTKAMQVLKDDEDWFMILDQVNVKFEHQARLFFFWQFVVSITLFLLL